MPFKQAGTLKVSKNRYEAERWTLLFMTQGIKCNNKVGQHFCYSCVVIRSQTR